MQCSFTCIFISIKPCILRKTRWFHIFINDIITFLNWINSFVDAASRAGCRLLMSFLIWAHFSLCISSRSVPKETIMSICLSLNLGARCHHYWIINWIYMMVSPWTVVIIVWSHVWKNFWESLSISSYSLSWISERQFFPCVIVCLLSMHVHQIFFARCTCLRPYLPLAKHRFVLIWSSLSWKQIHNFSYFFAKNSESFHHIIFICKLIKNLLDHISKFI